MLSIIFGCDFVVLYVNSRFVDFFFNYILSLSVETSSCQGTIFPMIGVEIIFLQQTKKAIFKRCKLSSGAQYWFTQPNGCPPFFTV
jgi:hypothetical protein